LERPKLPDDRLQFSAHRGKADSLKVATSVFDPKRR